MCSSGLSLFFLQRLSESTTLQPNRVRSLISAISPKCRGDRQERECKPFITLLLPRSSTSSGYSCLHHAVSATALRHVKVIPDTAPRGQHADRRSGWTPQEREDLDDPCHDTRYRDHCCDASSMLCKSTSCCPSVYRPVQHGDNLVLNWACHSSQAQHSSSPSPWLKTHSQTTAFCPPCTRCTASLRERSSDWLRYQVRK